ncbi:MAG: ABC transporter substrate-binding protein, partial [Desulfobacterales bacterium]|nr:ABC transporter substrate-binding protein [Desulfobacterales bacterium]
GWGVPISGGMQAWVDHINAKGGIHGRKIKLMVKDDGYNPARAMANLQQMKNQVFAICGQLGSAPCNATKDFYPQNKIPLITAYGNLGIYANQPKEKQKYYFIAYPNYEDETEYMATYSINKLGAKKIAHFYQNDEYGLGANAGIKKALKANPGKATLVAEIPYETTERALGTHSLKLKESGADMVILTTMMSTAAIMTKEMAKIAYKPKVYGNFPLGDAIMYKIAGENWEGTHINVSSHVGMFGVDPEADKVAEILVKNNPKLKGKEFLALFGAASIMHLAEGLKNTGPNLTREALITGMEKIKNWKPEGMGAPVTYAPGQHHGMNAIRPCLAKDGKHVPIGDHVIFKPKF